MALYGKLENDVKIKALAEKFHEILHQRLYYLSNICSDKIQHVKLHDGEWGKADTILDWRYVLDGKVGKGKKIIEDVDEEKNSFTWKLVEGDLLELYKNLKIIVQCIPKDEGSVIHYALEYEKLHEGIPDPHSLFQLCADITKDIEAHLIGNNNDV
ncbi:MLP-like protein 43, partial [Cucurbita argyrosperma subsp. sororia]